MNEKGQTLIEVVIGVVLIALVFTGLFQGLSVGIWATFLDDQLTTAQQIAQSEIDYIKSQDYDIEAPYQYNLILDLVGDPDGGTVGPEEPNIAYNITGLTGFTAVYSVSEVPDVDPTVLQQITMTVSSPGGRPQTFVAYKANIEYGEPTQCIDLHKVEFTIDTLTGPQGYYYVISPDAEGPISASWVLVDKDNKKNIEIYIYMGTPFGPDEGKISTPPGSAYIARSTAGSKGSASTPSYTVPPGDYTVYFYNPIAKQSVETKSATINYTKYTCP